MAVSMEGKVGVGFGAALLLLTFAAVVSYRTTISLLDTVTWVNHAHEILAKVESLLSHVKDIETGMRGYVITGRGSFLAPYETALAEVEHDFTALRILTADNPHQQRNLDTLAPLIEERTSHARRAVDLRREEGLQAAVEEVQKGQGQETMDAIRKVVQQIQEEGRELLRRREEATSANARRTIVILLLGSTMAIIIAAFANMVISRELAARRRAEAALHKAHDELEIRVQERTADLVNTNAALQTEIGERKRAEAALRESEKRFRALVERSSDAIALNDSEGALLYVSPATERILGYANAELIGRNALAFMHPDDHPHMLSLLAEVLRQSGNIATAQYRVRHRDGSWRWIEGTCSNLLGEPSVQAIVVNFQDITERKQAARELEENHSLLRAVVEDAADVVIVKDLQGRYVMINPAGAGSLGKSVQEVIGKDDTELMSPDTARQIMDRDRGVITAGEPQTYEEVVTAMGVTRTYLSTKGVYRDQQGNIIGLIGISRDITERKQTEETLRQYTERLEVLHEIDQAILAAQTPEAIAHAALGHMQQLTPCRRVSVVEFNRDASEATMLAVHVDGETRVGAGARLPAGAFGVSEELRQGKVRSVEDIRSLSQPFPPLTQALQAEGVRSYINVPLVSQGELIGALNLEANNPNAFTAEHIEVAREVADQLAVAIQQARLREQVERYAADLEQRIAERERAEEELRASERRFRALIESSSDAVALIGVDGTILYGSPSTTQVLGYALDEFVGHNASTLIHQDDQEFAMSQLTESRQRPGGKVQVHARVLHKDSSWRWMEGLFTNLFAESSVQALVVNYRDVTERKQAEEVLAASEQRFRTLAEALPALVWMARPDGFLDYYNQRWYDYTDLTAEQLTGWGWEAVWHPADLPDGRARWLESLSAGEPYEYEARFRRAADGSYRWHLIRAVPLRDPEGRVLRWFGTNTDIEEKEQTEAALRESEERLRLATDSAEVGIWHYYVQEDRLLWSPQFKRLFGLIPDDSELTYQMFLDYVHPEDRQRMEQLREVLTEGKDFEVEYRVVWPDGRVHWIAAKGQAFLDDTGQPVGFMGVALDATERRRAEEEILRLNAELEQRVIERTAQLEAANKELEAFSYSVSHDLRAPVRAMAGFARLLLTDYASQLVPGAQHYLQRVQHNAQRMGQLIDDLLAFSRLSRQPLKTQQVAPAELVHQALESLRDEQDGRQVAITIGELPHCQADPALLAQVFVNLLANALKFTRQREVAHIEVGCRQANGEQVYFMKDDGTGFDMQYANKLFGVFQRLHGAEEYEGTGVGLAIVQRIIQRHGGQVWAEAAINAGATFFFTLSGGKPDDGAPSRDVVG